MKVARLLLHPLHIKHRRTCCSTQKVGPSLRACKCAHVSARAIVQTQTARVVCVRACSLCDAEAPRVCLLTCAQCAANRGYPEPLRLSTNRDQFTQPWLEDLPKLPPQHGPDSATWSNSIAICAIMKDENVTDVREWLTYHQCASSFACSLAASCTRWGVQ